MQARRFDALILAAIVASLGCSEEAPNFKIPATAADGRDPLVIVYLIDTLRADHMGLYGYDRPTTPEIERLAEDSVVFDAAYAPSSWTRASVGSLFTGRFPSRHGAVRRDNQLRSDVATLAESLRGAGFESAGFVSNPNVLALFGFDRGFTTYVDVDSRSIKSDAAKLNELALAYLKKSRGPRFLYIHTIDPHLPYEPPEPFASAFARPAPAGKAGIERARVGVIDSYDAEVAYADQALGEFRRALESAGLYEDAVFVLVSDHGEEFFDHQLLGHGHTLFEEQVHIPMLIKWPGARLGGERVGTPVRLVDVMPSLLEHLGIAAPEGLDGASFLAHLETEAAPAGPLFFEQSLGANALTSVREGPLKLIRRTHPAGQRGLALYDLASDPGERRDLSQERPEDTERLAAELAAIEASLGGGHEFSITNAAGLEAQHSLEARLWVEGGRLEVLELRDFEDGDRALLSEDGTSLALSLGLRNLRDPGRSKSAILTDSDWLRLRVHPATARLHFAATAGGQDLAAMPFAGGESSEAVTVDLPFAIPADSEDLLLEGTPLRAPIKSEAPYFALRFVARANAPRVELDEVMDARLKALGYLEE